MDSPFSASTRPPVLSSRPSGADEPRRAADEPGTTGLARVVLVAGLGDPVAVDYAAFLDQRGQTVEVVGDELHHQVEVQDRADSLILFLDPRPTDRQRVELDRVFEAARRRQVRFVGIVSSFRVHLDDPEAIRVEDDASTRAEALSARVAVFRPGHLLSPSSRATRLLRRLAPIHPLFPGCLASCFLDGTDLFEAIEAGRDAEVSNESAPAGRPVGRDDRAYTLLGPNRRWHEVLAEHRSKSPGQVLTTAFARLLAWLMIGHLFSVALRQAARSRPRLRPWDVHTLTPRSIPELLSLCHRGNLDRVKVVGYNNGVVHFGRKYAGKTVVSTVHCRRMALAGSDRLKADGGATIRQAVDFLAASGRELYVIPNYSYVCLGTSFYVPIHGSAVDYSTVADTITRAVLYDPDGDRIISAGRDHPAFTEHVYNLRSRLVLLRLTLLTKPKSGYFVKHQVVDRPEARTLLAALADRGAANVEIRQATASSPTVTISRYSTEAGDSSAPALELPRDRLGRLWDLLEENPVTSYLMHAVGRHVVWHEELFITEGDFPTFWETHGRLPLRKLQLRAIRRDGMAHSPFRDEDCLSVDLFMIRRHKARFLDYLKTTLPAVRTNPGKHGN